MSTNVYGYSLVLRTPKNIFLPESNPAAYILDVYGGFLSTRIRQANRDMVDCVTLSFSVRW